MGCPDENTLAAFLEGRLSRQARVSTEAHVGGCADCLEAIAAGKFVVEPGQRGGEAAEARPLSMPAADDAGAVLFRPGNVVASRYLVTRYIARGGMGEVYEVEDRELYARVALKAVRGAAAGDPRARFRLRREIQLARRVTHPNVCRIFDVGIHGEVPFLTMELLQGETLGRRIRRAGRVPREEALPMARQMAAALVAAHEAGVVHRDFKADNVLLVPERGGRVRAVVTDFGLARAEWASDAALQSAPVSGAIAGTPAYMAPEQVEGGAVTARSDIYSLGIVLYEMVTGTLPFTAEHPLATAVKRLKEAPRSPRELAPDLPPHWEAAILRCLARDPADRFATAGEVVDALESARPAGRKSPRRRGRATLAIALALLPLAAVAWIGRRGRPPARVSASPPPPPARATAAEKPARRSLAILGFRNLGGQAGMAWVSTALQETLTSALSAGEQVRTMAGEEVALMKSELALPDSADLDAASLSRVRAHSGVDYVLVGGYRADLAKGTIELELHLFDADSGAIVDRETEAGTTTGLLDLVERASERLRRALGVASLDPAETAAFRATFPANAKAAELYAEGLSRLRAFDALTARDRLEKAVALDPGNGPAHAVLAQAWARLGYDGSAEKEARRALELSGNLSREERLWGDASCDEAMGHWDEAVTALSALWLFFPDNLSYGVELAEAQVAAERAQDALATIAALRALPPPAGTDARIDLAEAEAAAALSDFPREQKSAARAAREADAEPARFLVAEARLWEGAAFQHLGQPARAEQALAEARKLFSRAGDKLGEVRAIDSLANVTRGLGDPGGALALYEQAQSIARSIDARREMTRVLDDTASALFEQGDLAGAEKSLDEALGVARATGNRRAEASALEHEARIFEHLGDVGQARGAYEEALAIRQDLRDRAGTAGTLTDLARLLYRSGDPMEAVRTIGEALSAARAIRDLGASARALYEECALTFARDVLAGAEEQCRSALATAGDIGDKRLAALVEARLSAILLEQDHAAGAESMARAAADALRAASAADEQVRALAALTRALSVEGRLPEAKATFAQARELATKSQDRVLQLAVAVDQARLDAATDPAEAMREIAGPIAQAAHAGLIALELEGRLVEAQAAQAAAQPAAGQAASRLALDAGAAGFERIARQARGLQK